MVKMTEVLKTPEEVEKFSCKEIDQGNNNEYNFSKYRTRQEVL